MTCQMDFTYMSEIVASHQEFLARGQPEGCALLGQEENLQSLLRGVDANSDWHLGCRAKTTSTDRRHARCSYDRQWKRTLQRRPSQNLLSWSAQTQREWVPRFAAPNDVP